MRSDHRHLTAYQIGCEVGQYVVLVLRPAILDHNILALDVAGFTKALPECGQIACTIRKRRAAEESDRRHRRLLRARRERPHRCAAEQRDEVAPFHCPMPPVLPTERIAHLSYSRRLLRCVISVRTYVADGSGPVFRRMPPT